MVSASWQFIKCINNTKSMTKEKNWHTLPTVLKKTMFVWPHSPVFQPLYLRSFVTVHNQHHAPQEEVHNDNQYFHWNHHLKNKYTWWKVCLQLRWQFHILYDINKLSVQLHTFQKSWKCSRLSLLSLKSRVLPIHIQSYHTDIYIYVYMYTKA